MPTTATYTPPVFPYRPSPDQRAARPVRRPVVIAGGGPVGLTAAIDLAARGVETVVLEAKDTVSGGSRSICWAKRTLEIFDRLGVGERAVARGVTWQLGKVFHRDRLVHRFDLLPEPGYRRPAFINCQQYHIEEYLIARARELDRTDLRWRHEVTAVEPRPDHVRLTVRTPDGDYPLECDWLIAADGARSTVRRHLGLPFRGQVFRDRFLITDVVMRADFPPERRFWFDPPFHPGQSALLHRQPDDMWRIDLQLGWDADPEEEVRPERVTPRLRAMLGEDTRFKIAWTSVYTFQCRRLERFRHGRVLFVGDAAHQVSPFGARGCNGGIQDVDNLAWKLALVLAGQAPEGLLDSYDAERVPAADENILNSTRSTEFITPKDEASRTLREAVLQLAAEHAFARPLINSGRLSTPATLTGSPLNTPDRDPFAGALVPGAPCADAPAAHRGGEPGWLLNALDPGFTLLCFAADPSDLDAATVAGLHDLARAPLPVRPLVIITENKAEPPPPTARGLPCLGDAAGLAARRFDARPGTCYLLRPDQHVAARWRAFDPAALRGALARATAQAAPPAAASLALAGE